MEEPTVHDVLPFHRVDRAAYEHLVSLGAGRHPARDAVALLMWLHRGGAVDAVPRVPAAVRTPAAAARLVAEARAVLLHGAGAAEASNATEPLLLSCACGGEGDDALVRRFLASRGAADDPDAPRRGVAEVLGGGVGKLVFDDRLHEILRRHEQEGGGGGALPEVLAAPYRLFAAASRAAALDEDDRSLFITFSKGFPLTRDEVEEFFTERWGDCVAKVMVENALPGKSPTHGRVVLRHAATAAAVLGGQLRVKLMVNGRDMWARKYVPRRPRLQH